uniref:venom nerve growth factor-like n=1 Tax=Pristiophorus japonicus TaxID=55135 RepID=UPI00398F827A
MSVFCCLLLAVSLSAVWASPRIDNAAVVLRSAPQGSELGSPPRTASGTRPASHSLASRVRPRMNHLQPLSVEPQLFRSRPSHSSRVRFHSLSTGGQAAGDPSTGRAPLRRSLRLKRQDKGERHQGQFSVCNKQQRWVMDKKGALDIHGRVVEVVSQFYMNGTLIRQMFYETTCQMRMPTRHGCRGIDGRYWNSHCDTSDSHVQALVLDNKHIRWNYIRIRTACVCILTRKP